MNKYLFPIKKLVWLFAMPNTNNDKKATACNNDTDLNDTCEVNGSEGIFVSTQIFRENIHKVFIFEKFLINVFDKSFR